MRTPWGMSQHAKVVADGITYHSTPSHGGYKLSRKRNAAMPDYMRRRGGWYEEDCEYALVILVFASDFDAEQQKAAHDKAKAYYPDEYEKFTGTIVPDSESHVKSRRAFKAAHAKDWVTISARGSWHERCPDGKVLVTATLGGERNHTNEHRAYLVPKDAYDARSGHGYVIGSLDERVTN